MPTYPFMQVDAFTNQPLAGNPCVVVFDADNLDDQTLLAIAREMNLSETAFVMQSQTADFGARYFTPAEEIPLAGHPTIATAFALVESGRLKLPGPATHFTLELKAGVTPVEIQSEGGQITQVVMTQRKPQFLATYPAEAVLPRFGLAPDHALPGTPIQTVSTGTPQLMVPLQDLGALKRAQMDIPAYNELRARGDFFSPHLFCLGGVTETGSTFARHFGTPPDLLEDPFTGSATGGMAAYLWRYGLIKTPKLIAEQGHWMGRPGKASVEIIGPVDDIKTVKVGGAACLVAQGELIL